MKRIIIVLLLLMVSPLFSADSSYDDSFDITFTKKAETIFSFVDQSRVEFAEKDKQITVEGIEVNWSIGLTGSYDLEILGASQKEDLDKQGDYFCLEKTGDANTGLNYEIEIVSIKDASNNEKFTEVKKTNITDNIYNKISRENRSLKIISNTDNVNVGSATINLTIPFPNNTSEVSNGIYQGYLALVLTYDE